MKKLLIVSLLLLSVFGLLAQIAPPYLLIFNTTTEGGDFHANGTIGFKACQYNAGFGGEMWAPNPVLYWNWPEEADQNTNNTVYSEIDGKLNIQMSPLSNWGVFGTLARFWFIDADGNEYGPVDVAKLGADQHTHADVIAWGGPAGPVAPEWCTVVSPLDDATGVATTVTLTWANPEGSTPDLYDFYYRTVGAVDWMNPASDWNELSIEVPNLAYSTEYEWKIEPFVWDDMPGGDKTYPEGDAPVWSFTTEAAPIVYPTWATNATPENEATDVALMPEFTWTYDGPAATGYELYIGVVGEDMNMVADVAVMTYTLDYELDYNTEYTWGVKPYIVPAGKKSSKAQRITPKRYPNEGTMNTSTFTTTAVYEDEAPVVVPGDNNPNNVEVQVQVTFTGGTPAGFTPPVPAPFAEPGNFSENFPLAGAFNFGATVNPTVNGTYVFTFVTNILQGALYIDGVYQYDAAFPGGVVTVTINYDGAKDPVDIIITEPSLPVELSSFTAQAHANEYVTLKWVTESESNLQGYNVYRAETDNQDQAIRINPTMVAPANQTQTQTYTYTDSEVESTTYYYWLEVAELGNENSFHGPIVVTVEDEPVVPGITETTFRNFGPSPFTESTSTTVRVKEGETATVTIYNLLGQVVRRESFNAGEHNFEFNGRDLNNKKVANGIYFVRMTSPTQTKNFKIVKIK